MQRQAVRLFLDLWSGFDPSMFAGPYVMTLLSLWCLREHWGYELKRRTQRGHPRLRCLETGTGCKFADCLCMYQYCDKVRNLVLPTAVFPASCADWFFFRFSFLPLGCCARSGNCAGRFDPFDDGRIKGAHRHSECASHKWRRP